MCACAQSCPTLWDLKDYSLPASSVHVISQQEYWSGLPFSPPGDHPNSGIEPASFALALRILYHWATQEALVSDITKTLNIQCDRIQFQNKIKEIRCVVTRVSGWKE